MTVPLPLMAGSRALKGRWIEGRSGGRKGGREELRLGRCCAIARLPIPRNFVLPGLPPGAAREQVARCSGSLSVCKICQHRLHLDRCVEILRDAAHPEALERAPDAGIGGQHGEWYGKKIAGGKR